LTGSLDCFDFPHPGREALAAGKTAKEDLVHNLRRWPRLGLTASVRITALVATVAAAVLIVSAWPSTAQTKLTVFVGPVVYNDSIWMADKNGFYKAEGLDVDLKMFPSGATALQSFKAGQGDIVASGELPSVSYWASSDKAYRAIFAISRESKAEIAMAKKEITKAQDLVGKVVATRVGSTGSWLLSEYLARAGVDESKVQVKNLETQILPTALCNGDIDAFFIWQPFGTRAKEICGDKVHQLTDAEGYLHAYLVAGARPDWLAKPENKDTVARFIRATLKGKAIAEKDFKSVAEYVNVKFGMSEAAAKQVWDILERPVALDATFYKDYCQLTKWMRAQKLLDKEFVFKEFVWTDGLRAVAPRQVIEPPAGC
jgi:NitT/TauT family transport system substrate-binding protein